MYVCMYVCMYLNGEVEICGKLLKYYLNFFFSSLWYLNESLFSLAYLDT